ncbi:MAG: hypothetical protein P4L00_01385 [Candidatus Acidoferrales bacterium]|nr:hypothetical protein [Candidatus Acidoferrales bacterium]
MRYLKYLVLLGIFTFAVGSAHAQFAVQAGPLYVGPAPVCMYGYYGFAPYACAPYGYYGPEYFDGGLFIGAGPWFHGFYGRGFYGRPGYWGRPGFRGPAPRGFSGGFRGERGFRSGDFHGGGAVRGGRGFHGGGGSHGGGHR